MTQILYYVDKDKAVHAFAPETAEEIREKMKTGEWNYPVRYDHPVCESFREMLLVSESTGDAELTGARRQVAECLCRGMSLREIGFSLGYSFGGTRYYIEWLKRHYNVRTREEVIACYTRTHPRTM